MISNVRRGVRSPQVSPRISLRFEEWGSLRPMFVNRPYLVSKSVQNEEKLGTANTETC